MSAAQQALVDELRVHAEAVARAQELLRDARRSRDWTAGQAVAAGVPSVLVAETAGLTASRVSQLAGRTDTRQGKRPAPVAPAVPVRDAPEAPQPAQLVSGVASVRAVSRYSARPTEAVELLPGDTLATVLAGLAPGTARVYVAGPAAVFGDDVRAWFTSTPGQGWTVAPEGLYLSDSASPVGRWQHTDGRRVELHRAATWFGGRADTMTAADVSAALRELHVLMSTRFAGGTYLSTPSTTGRDLWRRTIPAGRAYPVLSDELRELLQHTSGQGRMTRTDELAGNAGRTLDGFHYLDGRFMYAALTWGLPVVTDEHPPRWWTRHELDALGDVAPLLASRGWFRATVTVPRTWAHVGLVPAPEDSRSGRGWRYPNGPGQTFTTWAGGAELALARSQGWGVTLLQGVTFAEGKPLNVWRDKLVDAWTVAAELPGRMAGDVRAALRAALLFGLGAFATRGHTVTRSGPVFAPTPGATVAGAGPRLDADGVTSWEETQPQGAWAQSMAHPEWPVTVWSRARVRLLDHPLPDGTRGGALHVPAAHVIGFRTDALYLSHAPGWADDGKPGRFRSKGTPLGRVAAPTGLAELFALRDRVEDGT